MNKLKKITLLAIAMIIAFSLFACNVDNNPISKDYGESDVKTAAMQEAELSFKFLWKEVQTDKTKAYGLVKDRSTNNSAASIASVGFALAAIPTAIENDWITRESGEERVLGTLDTFKNKLTNYSGFYYHFVNMQTGLADNNSEVSVIDTALFIAGALTAGEYFGGEIKALAHELYARVDWNFYTYTTAAGKVLFRMSYKPVENKFEGAWDYYAEQLVMYVLGAGAPNEAYRIPKRMFYDFARNKGKYGDSPEFIYSWNGSLFTHQFSHAFVDFRGYKDEKGVDWYQNSVDATINARNYCIANSDKYKTYGPNSWGLTACDTPSGYSGSQGTMPSGSKNEKAMSNGTIAPCAAIGSMPFLPKEVGNAIMYYKSLEKLQSQYGFRDAFNLSGSTEWYANDNIGIDKGISVVMISNHYDETIWSNFMQNEYILQGMSYLGLTKA